jgi:hypothetical protein
VRRLVAVGAVVALLLIAAVPFVSAGTTVPTKHVDGTVKVYEPSLDRYWLARFEVRTTPGVVQFGYLELYGNTPKDEGHPDGNLGEIHEFDVTGVDYYKTPTGQGATLFMNECIMVPPTPCFESNYTVSDGSPDTFLANLGWSVESGNISIYTTGGQNSQ